jgi:hypothetical protein
MRRLMEFLREETGGATVEFVAIMPFFITVVFLIFEIGLALFWWETAEKAAQVGARQAVVTDWVITGPTSLTNLPSSGSSYYGAPCDITAGSSDPCSAAAAALPAPSCALGQTCSNRCTGTGCANQKPFTDVYCRMKKVFPALQQDNVTVTYTYAGLGFVGGPIVPAVTVTVTGVRLPSSILDVIGAVFGTRMTVIPNMAVTLSGEDLSSANLDTSGVSNTVGGTTC